MKYDRKSEKPVMKLFSLMIVCMALLSIVNAANAEGTYAVIVNAANPVASLSSADVMNIFLGKKASWDDGKKIEFVTLKDGDANKDFLKDHVKKNPQQFKNYWKQMLFTGKGVIPPAYDTDAEVTGFVSQNPEVIGYVSAAGARASGVKAIQINN